MRLRRCMDIVMTKVPARDAGSMAALRSAGGVATPDPSFKVVAKLHTKLKAAVPRLEQLQARWDSLVREASELQAIIDKVRTRVPGARAV